MSPSRAPKRTAAVALVAASLAFASTVTPARAVNPLKPICGAAKLASGVAGKACMVVQDSGRLAKAGKQLVTGHLGGAVKTALGRGAAGAAAGAGAALGLAAIGTWVLDGAGFVLHQTAKVMGETTAPQLRSSWFSSVYWRVAGIAAILTLPFLFAAAVQALARSDLSLLVRAAFGYLPLAMLMVSIAAPLTMLLLTASDQLAAIVSGAAGHASASFLARAGGLVVGTTVLAKSPFVAVFVGVLTVAGAVVLWIELLVREAAVYVIVLMLPLAFAGLVWPARRVWAVRAVELLVALILAKFAIVAVLSLGGLAMGHSGLFDLTRMLAGAVLVLMAAFAPWAMLRLLPLAEVASGATGAIKGDLRSLGDASDAADAHASAGEEWAASIAARLRRDADALTEGASPRTEAPAVADRLVDAARERDTEKSGRQIAHGAGAVAERGRRGDAEGTAGALASSESGAPEAAADTRVASEAAEGAEVSGESMAGAGVADYAGVDGPHAQAGAAGASPVNEDRDRVRDPAPTEPPSSAEETMLTLAAHQWPPSPVRAPWVAQPPDEPRGDGAPSATGRAVSDRPAAEDQDVLPPSQEQEAGQV